MQQKVKGSGRDSTTSGTRDKRPGGTTSHIRDERHESTTAPVRDELGAHVSAAGGVPHAPARAAALDSAVFQLFTKQPSRWAEPEITTDVADQFQSERRNHAIVSAAAHDSYLINLASADETLFRRSLDCFIGELGRSEALGLDFLVTHPGNATSGDIPSSLDRNAAAIEQAIVSAPGSLVVLLETTAGSGSALGASFEELATLIARIAEPMRSRVGVCLDTCHVFAAGYDLRDHYDDVIERFADTVGLERLRLFHFNDSIGGLGSRRDRHANIGDGALGERPFQRLMTDPRFASVPKLLETPKGADAVTADRANLARLRGYRSAGL